MFSSKIAFDTEDEPTRRRFLQRGSLGLVSLAMAHRFLAMPAAATQQSDKRKRIVKAQIGNAIRIPNSWGDVWTATWADDDNLYSVRDDTTGFNKACNSNLAVQRISGGRPGSLLGLRSTR